MVVKKPWGTYTDHFRTTDCVFKTIVIKPGEAISYQMHGERSEFWFVSKGKGLIKTSVYGADSALSNYLMSEIAEGEFILIPKGTPHQISNNGDDDLIIFEMQFGNCSEDDIIRLHDPYERQ